MAGESFNFWNGKSASNLEELAAVLKEMSYEEFSSFVNTSKNDFANWIEGSLENRNLAEKIRPLLEKDLILAVIEDSMSKKQDKLIIGTTAAIQEDSLVKEIMKKNEDFFKEAEEKGHANPEHKNNSKEEHKKEDFVLKGKNDSAKENEKGSKLTFIDVPKIKSSSKHDFLIGIIFGIIIGFLLTLIIQQLILSW